MLSERLRQLREEKALSQLELGKTLGIGNSTLSNYEAGYRAPDNETLVRIADYFSVTTDYLLGRTDDRNGSIKITTIAAHSDNDLTEDEQEKIREFAKFLKSQRK